LKRVRDEIRERATLVALKSGATGFEAGVFESTGTHLGSDIVDKVPREGCINGLA
jgi:hypothetical protein